MTFERSKQPILTKGNTGMKLLTSSKLEMCQFDTMGEKAFVQDTHMGQYINRLGCTSKDNSPLNMAGT